MAVVASDMLLKYSVAASAGDTTSGAAATSLGDQVSTTAITSAVLNNLFDDVSGAEASAGDTEYRCVFVHNNHATDSAFNVTVAVQSEVAGGATITIALDNIGATAKGSASAQAAVVANENTAPSGVGSFGAGPLSIGTLTAGQVYGVWVKRTVTASTAALSNDGFTLRIAGEG
jgi:hypothetical protein